MEEYTDRRDKDEVIKYLEARVEVLSRRVAEQEEIIHGYEVLVGKVLTERPDPREFSGFLIELNEVLPS